MKNIIAQFLPLEETIVSNIPADPNLHLAQAQYASSKEEIRLGMFNYPRAKEETI